MNDHYLSHWQNSVSGLLDKDNYFETINGCFEQALTGFEWVLSLMKQAPQQNAIESSLAMFQPMFTSFFNANKPMNDYMQMIGFISSDAYNSLETKRKALEKERKALERAQTDDKQQIIELNKTIGRQNKKLAIRDKTLKGQKTKLTEQKQQIAKLNKTVDGQNKKLATSDKTLKEQKTKRSEQKKLVAKITKELTTEKKRADKKEKELADVKKLVKSLKEELADKKN
jgi:septal ring factor EnvC (AmiA/AmiB activator)